MRTFHADWLISLTEDAIPYYDGPLLVRYQTIVRNEMDNIRSALQWVIDRKDGIRANRLAGAIWRNWVDCSAHWLSDLTWKDRIREGHRWLEEALALRADVPSRYLIESLAGICWSVRTGGCADAFPPYAEELLARSRELGDHHGEYWVYETYKDIALAHGDLADAKEAAYRQIALSPKIRDSDNQLCGAYNSLGEIALVGGDWVAAESFYREGLAYGERCGNPLYLGYSCLSVAETCRLQGRPREALPFVIRGLDYLEQMGDVLRTNFPAWILANIALTHGLAPLAVRLCAYSEIASRLDGLEDVGPKISSLLNALPEPARSREWEAGTHLTPADLRETAITLEIELERASSAPGALGLALLSEREAQVARLLVEGKTNRVIGQELFISERTVERHVSHIMTKLDLDSRTSIVAWAMRNGIVA